MKITVFSTKAYDKEYLNRANSSHELFFLDAPLNADTAILAKGYDGVCVFVNDDLDDKVLGKLSKLGVRLIALRCAGFNNVDIPAAKKHGIAVVRVPAYSPEAVAEHALALIMTLNRKTHKAYNRVREGNFSVERLMGFNLYKKTVGVIGVGKIGLAFCRIMKGLGCNVVAFDMYPSDEAKALGVEFQSLEEVLSASDIISLHCPLNDSTHHLINKERLSLMKDTAMLINTSRGGVIDTKAVIWALKKGKLAYLGIDAYEQEEALFFYDHSEQIIQDDKILRLLTFPNVLITSHQGFFTHEAMEQIASVTIQNMTEFEQGKALTNMVGV